ncbi:hypothetical protein HPB52_004675 [Rhipicephalus sanguineus]|uniref:Uncharacterized protein n=1 Tax=Rhipicephalus sanguineus TaxID=34632 RepID=A0A9D4SVP3_RHISA|nr:hypothetical protein HPB52_004675 [Rhipicephalus sanguineus]
MSRAPWSAPSTSVEHILSASRQKLRRLRRRNCLRRRLLLGAVIEKAENLERTQPGAYIPNDGVVGTPWTDVFAEPSWIPQASPAYIYYSYRQCYTDEWPSSSQCQFSQQPVNATVSAAVADGEHEPCLLNDRAVAGNGAHSDDAPGETSSDNDEASGRCRSLEALTLHESLYTQADSATASLSSADGQAEEYDRLPSFEEIFYYGIYGRPTCGGAECSSSHCSGLTPL